MPILIGFFYSLINKIYRTRSAIKATGHSLRQSQPATFPLTIIVRPDICNRNKSAYLWVQPIAMKMKKTLRISVFLLLAGMSAASCITQHSVSVSQSSNNPDYRVSYLFEHDGCRVYRFYDTWSGSYVYFTTQGDMTAIPNDSTRRQTVTYRRQNDSIFVKRAEP